MIIAAKRSLNAAQGVFLAAGVGALMWGVIVYGTIWILALAFIFRLVGVGWFEGGYAFGGLHALSRFAGGIGKPPNPLPVDVTDGQEQQAANSKSQHRPQRAAAAYDLLTDHLRPGRTVPFVAKATGLPVAKVAVKVTMSSFSTASRVSPTAPAA